MTSTGPRSWIYGMLFVCAVGAAAVGMVVLIATGTLEPTPPAAPEALAIAQLELPTPRSQGYVGSDACRECHQDVAEAYSAHPMANSCAAIGEASTIEGDSQADFVGPDSRRYRSERTPAGRITHHEVLADQEGLLYDQSVDIAYVLGSGRHGRAYLHAHDGRLFQSPITWYSREAKWDLSPGYDPRSHVRFDRRIGDGCLYCHVGRIAEAGHGRDVYGSEPFAEAGIGCERCHGPGDGHIALRRSGSLALDTIDSIVNPASLDSDRRDAVCFSCHLQGRLTLRRFGREFFDFRPGDRIEDTLLVYLDNERTDSKAGTLPVSQVEQMMVSRCYQASGGELGCISCHDPHRIPTSQARVSYFRDRCLECHDTEACSAPSGVRDAPPIHDSCIDCHMPALPTKAVAHTSLTDHRVIRKPAASVPPVRSADPATFTMFGDEESLEPRERDRGRGLLLIEAAQGMQSAALAGAAYERLVPSSLRRTTTNQIASAMSKDTAALDGIATALWLLDRREDAVILWRKVLESEPRHERALHYLTVDAQMKGDAVEALRLIDQLVASTPSIAEVHARRAQILARLRRIEEAIEAAERGLVLDPTAHSLRQLLVELYIAAGNTRGADEQRRISERISKALGSETAAP
ncbi:MAG TPA: tetratricopeptide repeat protein [Pirellulaceae bacterium]|nr:tetratricopeptide repeat protein [Pirellulaceae bacterium]